MAVDKLTVAVLIHFIFLQLLLKIKSKSSYIIKG